MKKQVRGIDVTHQNKALIQLFNELEDATFSQNLEWT